MIVSGARPEALGAAVEPLFCAPGVDVPIAFADDFDGCAPVEVTEDGRGELALASFLFVDATERVLHALIARIMPSAPSTAHRPERNPCGIDFIAIAHS